MAERVKSYLGLGSNVGDRPQYLRAAVDALGARSSTAVLRLSSVYESEPEGPPQDNYLNMVVEIETELSPLELLEWCAEIEDKLGRVRTEHWGPRTIDIDILTYHDVSIDQERPRLIIPHPRMRDREFVHVPLSELISPNEMPDTSPCTAGRIIRKVGDLSEGSGTKGR